MRRARLAGLLLALLGATALLLLPPAAASAQRKHRHHRHAGIARLASARVVLEGNHRGRARRHRTAGRNQSSSTLLFRGRSISDFNLNQSAPGAITEVPDPAGSGQRVLKMTVQDSDVAPVTPTSDPRAQLLSPGIIEPGEEFWWSGSFYLPADFPSSVPGWLTVMEGPYGAPFDGTPPWHIEVNGSSLRWSRNDTYGWDVPWQMPLVRDSWVDVTVHERFAADGWVEMWVDGQRVTFFGPDSYNPNGEPATTRLQMATRDHSNDQGPNFTVIQSYRKAGMFNSVSLFQGPMSIGTTQAAVEG
jgi:Polysaccharide lyase